MIAPATSGRLQEWFCDRCDGVSCDRRTFDQLSDFAEIPPIVGEHRALSCSEKLRDQLASDIAEAAAGGSQDLFAGIGSKLGVSKAVPQDAQDAPSIEAKRFQNRLGIPRCAQDGAHDRSGFAGVQCEAVASSRARNRPPRRTASALEHRKNPVPDRAVVHSFRGVEFLDFERLDHAHHPGEVVGALEIATDPVKSFCDATGDSVGWNLGVDLA